MIFYLDYTTAFAELQDFLEFQTDFLLAAPPELFCRKRNRFISFLSG